MTTAIYFFLMSLSLFILPQIFVKFVTKEVSMNKNIRYLLYAAILPLMWLFLPKGLNEMREINFLQHAIGGGVAVGLVGIYLISNLKDYFIFLRNFFPQIILIYILVCTFGVTNELLEFFLDFTGVGIFSADRYDTWYDMVANTSGAITIYIFWKLFHLKK